MAYAKIVFQHPESGLTKEAPVGFSWTFLFFGMFVSLTRLVDTFVVISVIIYVAALFFGVGILINIIGAFFYNKSFIVRIISPKGYRAKYAVSLKLNTSIPIENLENKLKLNIPRVDESSKSDNSA